MKLDNKLQPSSSTEHKLKVAKCNGNREPQRLTGNDDAIRSKGKGSFITLAECLSREKDLEASPDPQVAGVATSGASINHGECGDVHATSYVPLPEFEMSRERNDLHTEKEAMEIEQPKTIVCFERGERQVVKDIGIDEGMDSSESVLQKDNEEFLTVFSSDEKHASSNGIHDSNILKSSFPSQDPSSNTKENLLPVSGFDARSKTSDHVSNEESATAVPSSQEHGRNSHEVRSFDMISDLQGAKYIVTENISPGKHDISGHNLPDVSNQDALEPGSSTTAGKPEHVYDGPGNSSVNEQNPSPVLGRDAEMCWTVSDEEIKTAEHQQGGGHPMIGKTPGENPTTSRNPFLLPGHYDDTVYGPHVMSDRINYAGPSAYSGSVSIRSDSSTTSTRSFAFPILQSEWNSSPVKMAKADRRHYRKYRGWRSRLLCCRF